MRLVMILLLFSSLASCVSLDKSINYNSTDDTQENGSITIHGTRKVSKAFVTINDSLFIDNKTFRTAHIDALPPGDYTIKITSRHTWGRELHNEEFNVMVKPGSNIDIVSNVPNGTPSNVAYLSFIGLFASLPFLFL
ncbi:MAG: hypothetical protein AAFY41_04190 [Bacteroidota bacterium]